MIETQLWHPVTASHSVREAPVAVALLGRLWRALGRGWPVLLLRLPAVRVAAVGVVDVDRFHDRDLYESLLLGAGWVEF